MIHPARQCTYDYLIDGFIGQEELGLVKGRHDSNGLSIFTYTRKCVYDREWNALTKIARGIILDVKNREVIATPFPKFFNVGEGSSTVPNKPFETFEKVDGSLIILFYHDGEWKTATKGSFDSAQAQWARSQLKNTDRLEKGTTYLFEAVYRENKIVVRYDYEALVLLAAYEESGLELSYDDLLLVADKMDWRLAERRSYNSISELLETAKTLPADEEGFVLRFDDGHRLKIKGDEYLRIHALISRVTPLAIWEAMQKRDDLDEFRSHLPEEFWGDFDQIRDILYYKIGLLMNRVHFYGKQTRSLTDKEVGLNLQKYPDEIRRLIFPYRKTNGRIMGNPKSARAVWNSIRPTGNVLPGYQPSYGLSAAQEVS